MELKIYNQSGVLKLTVSTSSSSTWNNELMTENTVSASWVHSMYVPLEVNDYVILEGVKFSIKKEYKPKQKNTQTYDYSVKFYAPIHDAEQVMYLNLTDGQYNPQFSLDGSPREHLQKWVDNMNRIYASAVWSIGNVVVADNQTIEYNNLTCWDALASMSETFNTEWWADGFVLNLSRCERGEQIELGYMQGLTSLTQSENSNDVKFFTRLIPLGSTKNIDASRYGFSRLQLPDKSKYVDRNTHYGLYEHVEEAVFAEIFPHYTGTVTSVRTEEKIGEDKKSFTVYYFKDVGMTFDPCENEIAGLVKHVSFQKGDLAGRDFEANYNSTTKEWEIINTYPSTDMQIPGGNLIPAVGNKYIPWNFRMPESYEKQAELDYKAAVDDFLTKYSDDVSKYGGDTDYIYTDKNQVLLSVGQRVRLLSDKYFSMSGGYRDTRMTKVVRKLDNLSIANIECTNQVVKGWKSQVDSSLSQLKYVVAQKQEETALDILKSWDSREATDYRVMSALRVLKEISQRALSSIEEDEAVGLIKFLQGLVSEGLIHANGGIDIGTFIPGLLGTGIRLKDGKIEADDMILRKSLTIPELIYNRIRVVGNEMWVTEGGDIESIQEDADSGDNLYWLKLVETDENTLCPFLEDDILRGIVKVRNTEGRFGGFYTVELRVVAIAADQTFSVIPRFADKIPVEGLTIARIGNFTNRNRMRSIYLSSNGGYIRFLDEVDGWDILPRMIKSQLGRMDGVDVPELSDIAGYNAFLDNVIARGAFVQVSRDGVTERPVSCYKGEWKSGKYYYYDEITYNGTRYLCIADTTEQQPSYDSTDWLMTEGNNKFSVSIDSSNGLQFFAGVLDTVLTARVYAGNEEITGSISTSRAVWTRSSGDNDADAAWNKGHTGIGVSLSLSSDDLPATYLDSIIFECTVTIHYADKIITRSDQLVI